MAAPRVLATTSSLPHCSRRGVCDVCEDRGVMGSGPLAARRSAFSRGGIQLAAAVSRAASWCETQLTRLLLLGRDGYGGPVGSCTPQALAACLNAGDCSSVVLMSGKYSPRASVRPGP